MVIIFHIVHNLADKGLCDAYNYLQLLSSHSCYHGRIRIIELKLITVSSIHMASIKDTKEVVSSEDETMVREEEAVKKNRRTSGEQFIDSWLEKTSINKLKDTLCEEITDIIKRDTHEFIIDFMGSKNKSFDRQDLENYDHRDLISHMQKEIEFLRGELTLKNQILQNLFQKPMMHDEQVFSHTKSDA